MDSRHACGLGDGVRGRSFEVARRPSWRELAKRAIYPLALPLYTRLSLRRAGLADARRHRVVVGSRGQEFELLVQKVRRRVRGGRLLLVGCGDGQEFGFWRRYEPSLLLGIELDVPGAAPAAGSGALTEGIIEGDVLRLPLADRSIDVIASINAFEHITDVEGALREATRVLRPDGTFLASFGPLYTALGGDHFSFLRGGLEHGFDHVLLDEHAHRAAVRSRSIDGVDIVDGRARDGLLYIEEGFFSRLRFDEYVALFERYLDIRHLVGHIDVRALEFRRSHPEKWLALLERVPSELDLLVSGVAVIGRPRSISPR